MHTNSRRKPEKAIYDVVIEGFFRLHSNWGQTFRFLRMLNTVQRRISVVRFNFQKSSYQGVQIPVGKIEKCSTTLVFVTWSDFPQSSPRFTLIDCCSQSNQIRRWYQCFRLQSCCRIEHAHLPRCPSACLEFNVYLWLLQLQSGIDLSHKLEISVFLQ
jgi:hypothetical protein